MAANLRQLPGILRTLEGDEPIASVVSNVQYAEPITPGAEVVSESVEPALDGDLGEKIDVQGVMLDEPAEEISAQSLPPITLQDFHQLNYWDLSLQEALQIALVNAKVLRNAGGTIVHSSTLPPTVLDPAIKTTDPRFGVEAALSKFDAVYQNSVTVQNLDRALNNSFFGGGTRTLKQDILGLRQSLVKQTASGAQFALYHDIDYDANNAPGNAFSIGLDDICHWLKLANLSGVGEERKSTGSLVRIRNPDPTTVS